MMQIIVIGGGIVGTSTAHYLRRAGASVVVVDRHAGAGEDTSFANAGSMTASRAGPWASKKAIIKTLKGYFNPDSAFKLALRADPAQWRWLWGFLRSARDGQGPAKRRAMIELAIASLAERRAIDAEFKPSYGGTYPQLLSIYDRNADLEAAIADADFLMSLGIRSHPVSRAECAAIEPSVDWQHVSMAGAMLADGDETADCFRFCRELDAINRALGVDCRYSTEVVSVDARRWGDCRVVTPQDTLRADAVVVAAGIESARITRDIGVRLPMYPVKGYSLSVQLPAPQWPRVTIADEKRKVFVAPIEGGLRAAGVADIVGYDLRGDDRRSDLLRRTIRDLHPRVSLDSAAAAWSGLRAMTHDGPPILCGLPGTGLWLNTGHGSLGWTFALGSGRLLGDMLMSRRHEPENPYFGLRHR